MIMAKKQTLEERAVSDAGLLTYELLRDETLDGVEYKTGDTFQAYANLRKHFESNGIAKVK
jgi:hypothetical protein